MKFAQSVIFFVQVIFIILVFVIVFYRPKDTSNSEVLGDTIDVVGTLNACRADVNKDKLVNELDYAEVKAQFLRDSGKADINNDKIIDLSDFSLVASNYYSRCI